ncbi:streptophobe family protein [Streptomyces griseorubiginosus]|uniref:streptophobe family protein n=1 Tax=Streptomyces griseorubiginosus TaxID=67304 RepID=UPI001FCC248B|nr:streptophobe family protein [Streptomyces griseorubiginosus]
MTGPWRNALEGAVSAVCAVVAMAAVSALALGLLGAGSYGSLWPLTMAVTAMAVGGPVAADPAASPDTGGMGGLASLFGGGGGGVGPSMSGAAEVMPLGVTLVGAIVLWVAFSWRLSHGRRQVRLTGGALAVRAAGAGTASLVLLVIVAALARGTVTLPASATAGMRGSGGDSSGGGLGGAGGGLADLFGSGGGLGGADGGPGGLGGLFGGGGTGTQPTMAYHVAVGPAGLGALLWVALVLGVGCLISRRARLPLGGATARLRGSWGPSLSAVVRTVLALAAVPLLAIGFVGAVVGDRVGAVAGGTLLLAPNALVAFLTLGVGSSWTAAVHPVQSDSTNPLAAIMGALGGGATGGRQPDRVASLGSSSVGGWPVWLMALTVSGLTLTACAYRAARTTRPGHELPLLPWRGPLAGHVAMAERIGVVTALVLGAGAWAVGASGHFGVSMFGSEMGGMRGELSGSVLRTVVFGLLVGSLAGFAGSLLARTRGRRGPMTVEPDDRGAR